PCCRQCCPHCHCPTIFGILSNLTCKPSIAIRIPNELDLDVPIPFSPSFSPSSETAEFPFLFFFNPTNERIFLYRNAKYIVAFVAV
ncbi:hypothetical protein TIFTF001_009253, partial [Ficus carica]